MIKQKGATLIVVLILLVALTVIGTLAIRQSIVSLSIATNGQAQQLLIQNSDAAIFHIEDPDELKGYRSGIGLFGYALQTNQKGKELVFCYRGSRPRLYDKSDTSVIFAEGTQIINNSEGTAGYCRVGETANFFTSNRRAVLTQISVVARKGDVSDVKPFQYYVRGLDPETSKSEPPERIVVSAISLMPALSTAADADINECLSNRLSNSNSNDAGISLTACLTRLNVPFVTHVTEYILGSKYS